MSFRAVLVLETDREKQETPGLSFCFPIPKFLIQRNVQTPSDRQSPSDRILAAGLQRLDLKLFVTVREGLSEDDLWDRMIAVFGRWRHDEGEDLIDLQDYAHIPNGPGIVLVSKRWVLSLDCAEGRPGVLLSTRRMLKGSISERFAQAMGLLFKKAARLLKEEELKGVLTPRSGDLSISVNDRVLFPNTDEVDAAMRPEVEALLAKLYGDACHKIERVVDPKARLSYRIEVGGQDGARLENLVKKL